MGVLRCPNRIQASKLTNTAGRSPDCPCVTHTIYPCPGHVGRLSSIALHLCFWGTESVTKLAVPGYSQTGLSIGFRDPPVSTPPPCSFLSSVLTVSRGHTWKRLVWNDNSSSCWSDKRQCSEVAKEKSEKGTDQTVPADRQTKLGSSHLCHLLPAAPSLCEL